jgi:uncharacterized protein YndB with AHSA1/START domain
MTLSQLPSLNPELDLVLERVIDVPVDLAWRCWTEPEHVKHWFTPRPWTVTKCEIDLRPGGIFRVVQRSPEGMEMDNLNCILEAAHHQRLVWTEALEPGFRPASKAFLDDVGHFTACISFEAMGDKTRYTARVMHATTAGRDKHDELGFSDGWGTALDQMIEYAKTM